VTGRDAALAARAVGVGVRVGVLAREARRDAGALCARFLPKSGADNNNDEDEDDEEDDDARRATT
jgi:hypothetical protein